MTDQRARRRQYDSVRRRLWRAERHLATVAPDAPAPVVENIDIDEAERRLAQLHERWQVVDEFLTMEHQP